MSLREQDELPGPASTQISPRRSIWWMMLAAIVALAALAAAFMLGRTTVTPSDKAVVESPAGGSRPTAAGPADPGGNPSPATTGQQEPSGAQPGAANANFVITDRLLAHPPTYEDHQNAPNATTICLGDALRIANTSSRRLGLIDTPDESDASSTLGSVGPGAIFTVVVEEPGTFFISAAGVDGLLFRYVARRCRE